MLKSTNNLTTNQKGAMLVLALTATGLFLAITLGAVGLATMQRKLNISKVARAQAIHVAEAGVNYYRWVLYHDNEDYCNKETCIGAPDYGPYGPYEYTDANGEVTGRYELYITPPAINGSTIVNIKSVGWTDKYPNVKREIEVRCGIPSWSTYSTLSDADVRFGEGTEVWGQIHSNTGIRFDGVAHNVVSSSICVYDDPDHTGSDEFAVHTHVSPTDPSPDANCPPQNVPDRADVFMVGRSFAEPVVSFNMLDNYLNDVLDKATTSGLVLPSSGAEGYHITLNTDDTIDIRTVTAVTSPCTSWWYSEETEGIASETVYDIGSSTPANGVVFVKDKVWVDGQIDGNRLTILAFAEPITGDTTDIIINNDLTYTNYDGTDAIGLIAQRDITVGFYSEDDLQIDAALIAKEGRISRNHYYDFCGTSYIRNTITINGSLATHNRYGFAYVDGTGYQYRNLNYDNNLTFIPPPHFPTTGEYTFISWKEK